MAVKTTGLEFKAFYNDDAYWNRLLDEGDKDSGEVWHEDLELEVNGKVQDDSFCVESDLRDEDVVRINAGVILSTSQVMPRSFEGYFKAWRKDNDTAYVMVKVPKSKLDAVMDAVKQAGGSIL